MNDKVLIKLIVPQINYDFDLYIPVNEQIWKIKRLIIKSIEDLVDVDISQGNNEITMINKITTGIYKNNDIVINTDIRNATELVVLS